MRKPLGIAAALLLALFATGCNSGEDQLPTLPTNLEATVYLSTNVILDWDVVENADTYNAYRGTSTGDVSTKTLIANLLTATAYMDTTVSAGTTYYYQVTAVNTDGESAPSTEVSATPE